jgi:hypothetical protein
LEVNLLSHFEGATTFSIMTLYIKTLSLTILIALPLDCVSCFIYHYVESHFAECRYAEFRGSYISKLYRFRSNEKLYYSYKVAKLTKE